MITKCAFVAELNGMTFSEVARPRLECEAALANRYRITQNTFDAAGADDGLGTSDTVQCARCPQASRRRRDEIFPQARRRRSFGRSPAPLNSMTLVTTSHTSRPTPISPASPSMPKFKLETLNSAAARAREAPRMSTKCPKDRRPGLLGRITKSTMHQNCACARFLPADASA